MNDTEKTQRKGDSEIVSRAVADPMGKYILRVNDLLEMPENWDSYGARRVDKRAGMAALVICSQVVKGEAVFTPLSSGGIQIEGMLPCGEAWELALEPNGAQEAPDA